MPIISSLFSRWSDKFERLHSPGWSERIRAKARRDRRYVSWIEQLEERTLLATVGDSIWHDRDADGVRDIAEPGVAGAVVELFDAADGTIGNGDDVSIGTRITDSAGAYSFTSLAASTTYYAVFRAPVGFVFTTQDAGGNDALDSDADATGRTGLFSLLEGENSASMDAGIVGSAPNFGWALGAGSLVDDRGYGITTDPAGNVLVTGLFDGTVDFDSGPGTVALTSAGGRDGYVAKYTAAGALVWALRFGSTLSLSDYTGATTSSSSCPAMASSPGSRAWPCG
jgi:hypothetical protein